eukprot:scaffold77199_cov68-Phaeocystis_antarctica.AAC.3
MFSAYFYVFNYARCSHIAHARLSPRRRGARVFQIRRGSGLRASVSVCFRSPPVTDPGKHLEEVNYWCRELERRGGECTYL